MREAKRPPKGTAQLREWTCSWLFYLLSLLFTPGVLVSRHFQRPKLRVKADLLCFNPFRPAARESKNRELLGDYDNYLVPKSKRSGKKSAPFVFMNVNRSSHSPEFLRQVLS